MFGLRFIKASPTTFVLHYKNGRIRREGAGLAFFYYAPTSTIVMVPSGSTDLPFVFNEVTADFQNVTLQGQLTYRVVDPRTLASLMDFSVGPQGRHASDDPRKLGERLVLATQLYTGGVVGRLPLRAALSRVDAIARDVLEALKQSDAVTMLGIEILGLALVSVRPTPEVSRALEAPAREGLLREADDATYTRRNAAVEQERTIRENELQTEVAMEAKKRQIREAQIEADIAVETQRSQWIDQHVQNERKEADARAYALETTLEPVRDLDWRTLTAVMSTGTGDPRANIALAFRELAANAQKIGELNVSPELLTSLTRKNG